MASPFRKRSKTVLIGSALIAVGAAALMNRNKVAGLIGARSSVAEPPPPPAPPMPSNFDASGPPANTATPIPAPDPAVPEAIDVEAEVEAAAAEAGAIGGEVSEYASSDPSLPAADQWIPVAEAGEGEAEGAEQTEAALETNLQPPEGAGQIDAQIRIEEAIEAASDPHQGEIVEPRRPLDEGPDDDEPAAMPYTPPSGVYSRDAVTAPEPEPEQPTVETAAASEETALDTAEPEREAEESPAADGGEERGKDDDGSSWQTWSGQAIRP